MKISDILLLFIITIFISCDSDTLDSKEITSINVNLTDEIKYLGCSKVLNLKKAINLETAQNCLIGDIDDIIVNDTLLYILDKEITKSIFVFNYKGSFIKKIASQGKGPTEYISLSSIVYDKWANKLLVLDGIGKKLLIYSSLGDYVREIKLCDCFDSFRVLDEENLIFYSNFYSLSNKQFTICSKNGKVVKRFEKIPKQQNSIGYSHDIFCKNGDTCLFAMPFDSNIYSISNNERELYASFSFNGNFIHPKAKELSKENLEKLFYNNDVQGRIINAIKHLMLVDDILYFSVVFQHHEYSVFCDISTSKIIEWGQLISDVDHLFLGNSHPIGQTSQELIFAIEPYKEIERYKRLKSKKEYLLGLNKYRDLFENSKLHDGSNPSLLMFSIKNN